MDPLPALGDSALTDLIVHWTLHIFNTSLPSPSNNNHGHTRIKVFAHAQLTAKMSLANMEEEKKQFQEQVSPFIPLRHIQQTINFPTSSTLSPRNYETTPATPNFQPYKTS